MINRLLNLISRSRSEAKVSMVSSSSDQPPSSNGNLFFLPNMAKLAQKGAKRLPFHRGEGIRLIDRTLFKMELLRVSPLFVISMTILRWYDQSGKQAISLASTSALSVSLAYWMIISIFSVRFQKSSLLRALLMSNR